MAKKPTVMALKKKLNRIFSEFIRRRDAGFDGQAQCCSCNKWHPWKEMDAGHYVSRKHNTTLYHEKNVHAQCRLCNRYDEGNKSGYTIFLERKYGDDMDIVEYLDTLGHQTKQFRPPELLELIAIYKAKLKEM